MGAELVWQEQLQRQRGENNEKIQRATEVKEVSVEGDGVMKSLLLAEPAQITHQVSLQRNYTALIVHGLKAPVSKNNRKTLATLGNVQLFSMLTLAESCHKAALSTRCWKNYLCSLLH